MRLVVRAAAALCAGLGAWLSLGAVAIAPGAQVGSRVGVLPPVWILAVLVAAFVAIVWGLRWPPARVAPLFGALLCVLPWIPGTVPAALLTWQGFPAAVIWSGMAAAVIGAVPVAWPERLRRLCASPRRAPWLAGALSLPIFLTAWAGTAEWLPGGDEPHYLIITQSLLADGDLQIENNHRQGDHSAYFPGELKPDYLRRGINRQIYSIHAPGLPAVIAPAFAIAGYRGSVWFLLVCAALGAALSWRLAWELTEDAAAAWFAWAALSLSIPIVAQTFTVFPDGLSGVLGLVAVSTLVRCGAPVRWPLSAGGAALALLPWLHTRNAILAGTFGLVIAARLLARPDRWRALFAFASVPALSAAGWFAYFRVIYGTFDPSAPYGGYTQSSPGNLLAGVPGLLFDQQFGLFVTAPVWLLVPAGLAAMALSARDRKHRRFVVELLAVTSPYVLLTASYGMWWGGTTSPARFLVPVLWLLTLPVAVAWQRWRGPAERAVGLGLLTLTATLTAAMTWGGSGLLTFTTRLPYGPFQEWASRGVDLSIALPSLFRDAPGRALEQAGVWLAALLVFWLVLHLVAHSRQRAAVLGVPLAVIVASVSLTANWARFGVEPLRLDGSRHAALARARVDGFGVALSRFEVDGRRRRGVLPIADVLPALELRTLARDRSPAGQLAALPSLPAGDYRVRISTTEPRKGRVRLELGRGGVLVEHDLASLEVGRDGRVVFDVTLPMTTDAIGVFTDSGSTAFSAAMAAIARWPRSAVPIDDAAIVGRGDGVFTAFFPTDAQYAERGGVWVKAGGDVPMALVAAEGTSRFTLFVRNGPLPNHVELTVSGATRSASLAPNEETAFDVPWPAGSRALALTVRAAEAFRPIDADPTSADSRRLGVWIEFRE
jgi:hypothetical protein